MEPNLGKRSWLSVQLFRPVVLFPVQCMRDRWLGCSLRSILKGSVCIVRHLFVGTVFAFAFNANQLSQWQKFVSSFFAWYVWYFICPRGTRCRFAAEINIVYQIAECIANFYKVCRFLLIKLYITFDDLHETNATFGGCGVLHELLAFIYLSFHN
jgi:hypothetical protein